MTENNEKTLKRTEIEDNETEKVAGGVSFNIEIRNIADDVKKIELDENNPIFNRCLKCNTEGHTAENCPNVDVL